MSSVVRPWCITAPPNRNVGCFPASIEEPPVSASLSPSQVVSPRCLRLRFPVSDFVYRADHPRVIPAGSDVANVTTVAQRQGNKYIVNGEKKWITNGVYADFCTAAVRTGGPGQDGISALIIPLKVKGVTLRRMENSGIHASGTRYGGTFE